MHSNTSKYKQIQANTTMMQNINLMMNQYPYYMLATNHITPILTINTNIIYNFAVNIANTFTSLMKTIVYVFTFIINDIVTTSTKYLTNLYTITFGSNHDLAFIILVAAAFVFINFYDKFMIYNI